MSAKRPLEHRAGRKKTAGEPLGGFFEPSGTRA